jgi:biopolymer transport protein ExbD
MEFEGRKKIGTNMNISPLVDVVFLLLIFFMLSSHFVHERGLSIKLPVSGTAVARRGENIAVHVAGDGSLYLGEDEIGIKELPGELKARVESEGHRKVVIRADERIDLALAVRVMDIVKQAGSESLVISTERVDNGAE